MEISYPNWNSQENAYLFTIHLPSQYIAGATVSESSAASLPDLVKHEKFIADLLQEFLEKTKRYFVTPLPLEKVKKHLRHYVSEMAPIPAGSTYYKPLWSPTSLKMKTNEFGLYWTIKDWQAAEPLIQSDFFRSTSPAPQSPELPPLDAKPKYEDGSVSQPNLRTIHIQNTMDSLVPVGDLPLSDLPPLNFQEESNEKKEIRRRIREARLKVELAKLKAKRMSQLYYERYGEPGYESAETSLESSESDSDDPMGRYSYS
jgi:hypothetical protein